LRIAPFGNNSRSGVRFRERWRGIRSQRGGDGGIVIGAIRPRNTGRTDHLSFDAVGIPGFQFIEDPLEYDSRTPHSNMNVYERIQREDMMQGAVITAAFVYDAAMRDSMLPRKPLPKPVDTSKNPTQKPQLQEIKAARIIPPAG
jgi:hypothetical protein